METIVYKRQYFNFIKYAFLLLVLSTSFSLLQAQDRIIRIKGDTLYGKILQADSSRIILEIEKNEVSIKQTIPKTEIFKYNYQYKYTDTSKYRIDTLSSLGVELVYHKNGKPVKIMKGGKDVHPVQLAVMMKSDPEVYALSKKALKKHKWAKAYLQGGGFAIGFGLGQAAFGGFDAVSFTSWMVAGTTCIIIGVLKESKVKALVFEAAKKYEVKHPKISGS